MTEEQMKNQQIIIPILVAIVVGAAAFFGGMQYAKAQNPQGQQANRGGFGGRGGAGGFPRGSGTRGGNGGGVVGQILSADNNTLTVKLQDGSSKIVVLPENVMINKMAPAAKTDLTTGTNVAIFGSTNSDGSVTAQNVQVNPMFRGPMPSPSPR
jgi:hypothetical protein